MDDKHGDIGIFNRDPSSCRRLLRTEIMSLFFTVASRATASKNIHPHAMLNAIQHGVTIAYL
jgi:hypothetical protein